MSCGTKHNFIYERKDKKQSNKLTKGYDLYVQCFWCFYYKTTLCSLLLTQYVINVDIFGDIKDGLQVRSPE